MIAVLFRLWRPFLPLLRWVAARHFLAPVMAWVVARRLVPLSPANGNGDRLTVLALNAERYRADLGILAGQPDLRILELPSAVQGWVTAPFLSRLRGKMAGQPWFRQQAKAEVAAALSQAEAYLHVFCPGCVGFLASRSSSPAPSIIGRTAPEKRRRPVPVSPMWFCKRKTRRTTSSFRRRSTAIGIVGIGSTAVSLLPTTARNGTA